MNVIAAIERALMDDGMRERARLRMARLITEGDLLASKGPSGGIVRPSNFGSCSLALWAERNGMLDLPRSPIDDHLTRLDAGSLMGAWEACLFAEGIAPDWQVELEYEPQDGGHIDALAWKMVAMLPAGVPTPMDYAATRHPVEFKSSWDNRVIKDPTKENQAHILQAADYAHRVSAAQFTLVYLKPAADKGRRMAQYTFDAAPYRELVAEERARISKALEVEPPAPDPQAKWACATCRFSRCHLNKNKAANAVEAMF